jgi:hypothetical protein
MIKKPIRKIQLTRETLRVLSNEQISNVAGGAGGSLTGGPTATLTVGTGPFPSHGACTIAG